MSEILAAVEQMGRIRMDEKRFGHLCDVGVRLVVAGQDKVEITTEELWALLGELKEHRAIASPPWVMAAQQQRELWIDTYTTESTGASASRARDGWNAAIEWVRGHIIGQCEARDEDGRRCERAAGHRGTIHRCVSVKTFAGTPKNDLNVDAEFKSCGCGSGLAYRDCCGKDG